MQHKGNHTQFVIFLFWWAIIILFAASAFILKGEDVLFINGNYSLWQDNFFKLITTLGEGWIFVPVFIVSLFIRYSLSLSILAMAILHGLVCAFAKRVLFYDAPRPSAIIDNELLHFVSEVDVHKFHSFPSGHTATIFCFAVLLSLLVRNRFATFSFLLIALMVGYSRIYLLQHFLIDVTAGALIGVVSAFMVMYIFDRVQLPSNFYHQLKIKKIQRIGTFKF